MRRKNKDANDSTDQSDNERDLKGGKLIKEKSLRQIMDPLEAFHKETRTALHGIQSKVDTLLQQQKRSKDANSRCIKIPDIVIIIIIAILTQTLINFFWEKMKRSG